MIVPWKFRRVPQDLERRPTLRIAPFNPLDATKNPDQSSTADVARDSARR